MSIYLIEIDGVIAAQYQADSQNAALDKYALSLGFVDYSHLLDRVPLQERHRIVAVTHDDDQYWGQTGPTRRLQQQS